MTTFVRAPEAARLLGVSTPTLYAYVSRGRLARRRGDDGRTSLFDRDEVLALADRSRRRPNGPPPSIDVRVESSITRLGEEAILVRRHDLAEVAPLGFEHVVALLWERPRVDAWPAAPPSDRELAAGLPEGLDPVGLLATLALRLGAASPQDDSITAATRLLAVAPDALGARRRTGRLAHRLATAWVRSPSPVLVDALDTAMALLVDHELATSTLAVRVAASVRATPYAAFAAGLATVGGPLHGSASAAVHRFLDRCERDGIDVELDRLRAAGQRVPGFGHSVYRTRDPRFAPMRAAIGGLGTPDRLASIDDVVREVTRTAAVLPNVDLALGALTWLGELPEDVPIFAVARIAGWAAHDAEERRAPALRFRGLVR